MNHTPRILLVGDDPRLTGQTARLLDGHGYEVVTASSGEEALHRGVSWRIDLIITDLEMPGLSWTPLLKRYQDRFPGTPVIVLTSHAAVEDHYEWITKGIVFDALPKPYQEQDLHMRVVRALRAGAPAEPETASEQQGRILLVDDDAEILDLSSRILRRQGYQVVTISSGDEALPLAREEPFNLIITDMQMPGLSGEALLERLAELPREPVVVVLTAHGEPEEHLELITKEKAFDVISKPFTPRNLLFQVAKALRFSETRIESAIAKRELRARKKELSNLYQRLSGQGLELIKADRITAKLIEQVDTIAGTEFPVLITGESGTGKEMVARRIHEKSPRVAGPFVAVNCSAVPGELFESEFFGYVRGAFTGAHQDRKGLFEAAEGGSIFLDEIGEIALENQTKLLRVLQENEVRRVGESKSRRVNVRLVCATNQDIQEAVRQGRFRQDLYYRISVLPVHVPPLRERSDDIPVLAQHFIRRAHHDIGRGEVKGISEGAIAKLMRYSWPGNVRQLENSIKQAMIRASGEFIEAENVVLEDGIEDFRGTLARERLTFREARDQFTRRYLEYLLEISGGNISRAAEHAGKHRSELYELLNRYNIEPSRYRPRSSDPTIDH